MALVLLLFAAPSSCGKEGPPFLPVPLQARELNLREVLVRDGEVRVDFRVPSEIYSLAAEEEQWQRAELFRRIEGEGEYGMVAEVTVEEGFEFGQKGTIIDDSAVAGVRYEYRLELRKSEAEDWAAAGPVAVTVGAPPAIGGPVRIDSREKALALSWPGAADAPAGTAYRLARRESGDGPWEYLSLRPLPSPSYVDTTVDLDRIYCYRVSVVVDDGGAVFEGPPSAEVCGSASDSTPPPPPVKLIAVAEKSGVAVSWVASGAVDVLGYNIYRSAAGGPFERLNAEPVTAARYLDEDVAEGTSYRYRVTAVDNAAGRNESPFSNTAGAAFPQP